MRRFMIMVTGLLSVGCATKQEELEEVAKDWTATIRASQVMPIYPLSADIQPGDVFMVDLPIDRQQEAWKRRGYLPLDHHVGRLNPTGYSSFYGNSFLDAKDPQLPKQWMRPAPVGTPAWNAAPRASFPSYSFSVENAGGLSLALPIGGIPIGLGLMGSQSANGSVTMTDARTFGVDEASLWRDLRGWVRDNADYLGSGSVSMSEPKYLRVVSRVYLLGGIDVSLFDSSARAFGADVGAGPSVTEELFGAETKTEETAAAAPPAKGAKSASAENDAKSEPAEKDAPPDTRPVDARLVAADRLAAVTEKLNKTLKDSKGKKGGSMSLASASARSVSLSETFEPALCIGYLGFDCALLPGGALGPPVSTFSVAEYGTAVQSPAATGGSVAIGKKTAMAEMYGVIVTLAEGGDRAAIASRSALDLFEQDVGIEYMTLREGALVEGRPRPVVESKKRKNGFSAIIEWIDDETRSRRTLDRLYGLQPDLLKADSVYRAQVEAVRTEIESPRMRSLASRAEWMILAEYGRLIVGGGK